MYMLLNTNNYTLLYNFICFASASHEKVRDFSEIRIEDLNLYIRPISEYEFQTMKKKQNSLNSNITIFHSLVILARILSNHTHMS